MSLVISVFFTRAMLHSHLLLQPGRRASTRHYSQSRTHPLSSLSLLGALIATANTGWAASQDMREITSELIYNFALLSQTPNRALHEAYHICAFEEDIGYLQSSTLESQKIQTFPVFLLPVKAIADVKRCNLLYIQDYVPQKPLELQQTIQKDSVVTVVHASNRFTEHGHVVISALDKRYQFDLRIPPAKQAGIVFDARLLKLATNIIND